MYESYIIYDRKSEPYLTFNTAPLMYVLHNQNSRPKIETIPLTCPPELRLPISSCIVCIIHLSHPLLILRLISTKHFFIQGVLLLSEKNNLTRVCTSNGGVTYRMDFVENTTEIKAVVENESHNQTDKLNRCDQVDKLEQLEVDGQCTSFTSSEKDDDNAKLSYIRAEPLLQNQSWFRRITFQWPSTLLRLGKEKVLEEEDLPSLSVEDTSSHNLKFMLNLMNKAPKNDGNAKGLNHLHWELLRNFIKSVWFVQPQYFIESCAKITQSIALGRLINAFSDDELADEGFLWASVLTICGLTLLITHHQIFFYGWRYVVTAQLRRRDVCSIMYYLINIPLSFLE